MNQDTRFWAGLGRGIWLLIPMILSLDSVAQGDSLTHSTQTDFAAGTFTATRDAGANPAAPMLTLVRDGDFGDGRDGSVTVSSVKNMNADVIAGGRSAADGIAYRVLAIGGGGTTITLDADPSGAIAVGDRVLVVNLQGGAGAYGNVGAWELKAVSQLVGSTVTLSNALARIYGASSNNDLSGQKVVCQRVPQYQDVTINSGGQMAVSAWDGLGGFVGGGRYRTGIVAFMVSGTLTINSGGQVLASSRGYRGGDIPSDHRGGDGGESITGLGGSGTVCGCWSGAGGGGGGGNASGNNGGNGAFGGGGASARNDNGASPGSGSSTGGGGGGGSVLESWSGGGGGYGTPGLGNAAQIGGSNNGGVNVSGNGYKLPPSANYTVGGGGGSYGLADLSQIYYGSGGGGGGIYEYYGHPEWSGRAYGKGGSGGGIILLWASAMTNDGLIVTNGGDSDNNTNSNNSGGGGGAGGSVYLVGHDLSLGANGLAAYGGHSLNSYRSPPDQDLGETGGRGRIRVVHGDGDLTGSSIPSFDPGSLPFTGSGAFQSPTMSTTGAIAYGNISWDATVPGGTSVSFATRSSPDGAAWSAWSSATTSSGSPITSPADEFLQYKIDFTGTSADSPTVTSVTIEYSTLAPLTIDTHPQPQTACPDGSAVFSVEASGGGTITYQWRKDAGDISDGGHYSGTATDTLTISNAVAGDAGSYDCVVGNEAGTVASNPAVLTVDDADADSDGAPDCADGCPNDPAKLSPGICGCGTAETDTDNDGTPDCNDVERLLHFQGKLRSAGGSAISGTRALTFRIYDAGAGGTLLFTEAHGGVTIVDGLFSALIGAQTTGGIPDLAVEKTNIYVSVAIDGGAELSPRSRVPADPYAIKAKSAEQLVAPGTLNPALTVDASGQIGIGTSNPQHPLEMASGAHVTTGGTWVDASSRKLKHDIASLALDEAVETLRRLDPVTFRYNAAPHEMRVGFIAEDVPELVATADRTGVGPMDIVAVLTRVVKEQQETIRQLQAKNARQESRIEDLERRFDKAALGGE